MDEKPQKGHAPFETPMVLFYFVRWGRSRPWSRWGHIDGVSHLGGCAYSVGRFYFYRQGLKSGGVRPIPGRRRPGGPERAETWRNVHSPSRNGEKQSVVPSWYGIGFRPGLRTIAGPASYHREVLRGERPKRFFPPFLIAEKWGPAERPQLGRWSLPMKSEKDRLS